MGKVHGVSVIIGIPTFGMVSTMFLQSRLGQQFPLVSSSMDKFVIGKPIADARNEIVQFAIDQGADYIYWLDDDVIAPGDAFLKLFMQQKDIINGVYWSKSTSPMPLLFRNHLEGPYLDWHVGDLIEVDAAGNGLTLVKTDVYKKISETQGGPWYSTDYASFVGATASPANNTEDLYFYWKARKAGFKIWVDTSVQAFHYDKMNNVLYQMPPNAPQAHPEWEIKPPGKLLIADIGSGAISPYFLEEGKTTTFDIREEIRPDVVCDVRRLPVPDQTFDIVFSSHTLEHFGWVHIDKVLKEWTRILKVGGELRLNVPNLRYSAKRILDDQMNMYDFYVLYGEQEYPKNFHATGFTPKSLYALVQSLGYMENIEIKEGNIDGPPHPESWNLYLKATKARHPVVDNIAPDYLDPAPTDSQWWPVRLYQTYNERPLTDEEKAGDLLKWLPDASVPVPESTPNLDVFYPNAINPNIAVDSKESLTPDEAADYYRTEVEKLVISSSAAPKPKRVRSKK